jgi:hypothetical protein
MTITEGVRYEFGSHQGDKDIILLSDNKCSLMSKSSSQPAHAVTCVKKSPFSCPVIESYI